jgi:hypothetical protein
MSQPQFNENNSYRRYVELLRQLHAALSSDPVDEALADEIRDEMDAPWYGLSSAEIDRVAGLSADLYSLEEKEDRPADALTDEGRLLKQKFERAFDHEQWHESLAALRKAARYYKLSDVSSARARIWSALGDDETSVLFLRHFGELTLANVRVKLREMGGQS